MSTYRVDIASDHPCFEGHFPGFPILPAVAQFGILTDALSAMIGRPCIIEAVSTAKFLKPVYPGVTLAIEIDTDGTGEALFVFRNEEAMVAKGRLRYRQVLS